jgi:hypothetical protein
MADLFCLVFKPMEGDIAFLKSAQSDMSNRLGENSKVHEAARIQEEEVKGVEQRVCYWGAGAEFNPAENLSFLLEHRLSPGEAIDNNGDMDEGDQG